jgi:hypothetical protein
MRRFVDKVQAARIGNTIKLRMLRDMAAAGVAFDAEAPHLDRLLAAAASGVMRAPVVEAAIREDAELRQAVVDLAGAQTGDVSLGPVAGRDVVTINVYLGPANE